MQENHATNRLLYAPAEAAQLCGIGRSKFYELMASGDIESVRIGSLRRIPRDALLRFVDELRTDQASV